VRDEIQVLRSARPSAAGPSSEVTRQAREDLLVALAGTRASRRLGRRRVLPLALPAAAAIVAVVVVVITISGRGGEQAWAAALVKVAEAAPRLLVSEPGWQVERADELSARYGEMTFTNGERDLDVKWLPARLHEHAVATRMADPGLDDLGTAPAVRAEARMFRYSGTRDFVAVWLRGNHTLEVRGAAADASAFRTVLASLREVDVDTWLSAMPQSVVAPAAQAEAVREMLADIPLPPGFDPAEIPHGNGVRDRYHLGAAVVGAVACAWIDHWVAARRASDHESARAAVEAMATSRTWSVLLEMDDEGAYPEVLWKYADALATNAPVMGGRPLSIEESYVDALCGMR
jgi:hypothetical protein